MYWPPAELRSREIANSFKPADLSPTAAQSLDTILLPRFARTGFTASSEIGCWWRMACAIIWEVLRCLRSLSASLRYSSTQKVRCRPTPAAKWVGTAANLRGRSWGRRRGVTYGYVLVVCLSDFCPWRSAGSGS